MSKKITKQNNLFIEFLHWLKAIGTALSLMLIVAGIVYLIPQPFYTEGFKNLTELQKHANTLDERIKSEGGRTNLLSYESYYQKNFAPGVLKTLKEKLDWLLTSLHLKKAPIFSASFFKTILEDVTKYRMAKGWRGDFIQKIELRPSSKIVIFGPVQGALHGLVRYLEQLTIMNIIDEKLKIKSAEDYIVFLGDVVNRSPYTLEIFSIVLRLIKNNPDNVIYLRGPHEISNLWKQHTLRRELELRTNCFSSESIPMETEVNTFFNTLPWTLYCTIPYLDKQKLNYFKCAALIEDQEILNMVDAPSYATFLKQQSHEKLISFNLKNRNTLDPEAENIIPRALVRGVKKRELREEINGLKLLPPTKGVITWTILSTTVGAINILRDFSYDSFTVIQAAQKLTDWTIDLYQKDIKFKENKTFKKTSYFFFTGILIQ